MNKPYYKDEWVTIYHGDCRELLPQLGLIETVITDPVWPNAAVEMEGRDDPVKLFAEMCQVLPAAERIIVQLGCDSDPRFLTSVPVIWPFLRVCWLDYARPSYKGRLLYSGDVAYAFGRPPAYIEGRHLMAGMCRSSRADKDNRRGTGQKTRKGVQKEKYDRLPHPAARRLEHVKWLVHQFSDGAVCDPFMGSGTTAVASKYLGRKFIGIEIEEKYCEIAVKKCSQFVMRLEV